MKTITIYPEDIVPKTSFMHDRQGRHDLLGQILLSGYGIDIPVNCRTPQELKIALTPFTMIIRRHVYCLTDLTIKLLALNSLPGKKQVSEANKLLAPYSIKLITEQDLETMRSNI